MLTVLAGMSSPNQIMRWKDLGATYPILWDEEDYYTRDVYTVTDRPLFLTIDQDMTIQYRGSNEEGMLRAEAVALELLGLD